MASLTRAQAREIDSRAMSEFAIPGLVLMENAAAGIAREARSLAAPDSGPVAIVCGPGNNGGDGFAAARQAGVGVFIDQAVEIRCVGQANGVVFTRGIDSPAI